MLCRLLGHRWSPWDFDDTSRWRLCERCGHGEYEQRGGAHGAA
jgi:hypothetical protein